MNVGSGIGLFHYLASLLFLGLEPSFGLFRELFFGLSGSLEVLHVLQHQLCVFKELDKADMLFAAAGDVVQSAFMG